MNKVIDIEKAVDKIKEGMTVMVGGFMGCGNPHKVLDALAKRGTKNLTLICNDGAIPGFGVAKLIENHQIKKMYATHIGLNPEVGRQMNAKEMEVVLNPQGTFTEKIRCGGNGMGGFLTPTGIGTIIEEGKKRLTVDGTEYLLETPLKADVALICGNKIDKNGNVWYKGTTRNFNVVMATAADLVIAEADNVVEIGEIEPENVATPGIFVDYIVDGGNGNGKC